MMCFVLHHHSLNVACKYKTAFINISYCDAPFNIDELGQGVNLGYVNDTDYEQTLLWLDTKRDVLVNKTKKEIDLEKAQRCLGWQPMKVVEKTIKATTQLAHNYLRLPMRRHFKSRFPQLNVNRLREKYATDTLFSNDPVTRGK